MKFLGLLQTGRLIKRYKRFLADVALESGEIITIHCPNTGSMLHCEAPGSTVWFSQSDNPKRKYPHTWELVSVADEHVACINTHRANTLVKESILAGEIEELSGYASVRSEVPYGEERSRIDFVLENHTDLPSCYVEVKSVTLGIGDGLGLFPDAITRRGAKHLRELMAVKAQGNRAILFFCVLHSGVSVVSPADSIDPEYGRLLRQAISEGVEVVAYKADISPREIALKHRISVLC
jgi:sugar fermentation stimulation protein A